MNIEDSNYIKNKIEEIDLLTSDSNEFDFIQKDLFTKALGKMRNEGNVIIITLS